MGNPFSNAPPRSRGRRLKRNVGPRIDHRPPAATPARRLGPALHPDKTRLIEFGHYVAQRRPARGEGKPETIDFLGFTHICGKAKEGGWFTLGRHTIAKRMRARSQKGRVTWARMGRIAARWLPPAKNLPWPQYRFLVTHPSGSRVR
jgi:hypothetical protein